MKRKHFLSTLLALPLFGKLKKEKAAQTITFDNSFKLKGDELVAKWRKVSEAESPLKLNDIAEHYGVPEAKLHDYDNSLFEITADHIRKTEEDIINRMLG